MPVLLHGNQVIQTLCCHALAATAALEVDVNLRFMESSLESYKFYAAKDMSFFGPFAKYRSRLDYTYHSNFNRNRQELQDLIISSTLEQGVPCDGAGSPWLVFTAGSMGSGKTHTLRFLKARGIFGKSQYVLIDADSIKCALPEMRTLIAQDRENAGSRMHRESGYIAEIIQAAALDQGKMMVVDGSLRDHDWYSREFAAIREEHREYRIAILAVLAEAKTVFSRARRRDRAAPLAVLQESIEQVPRSLALLGKFAEYMVMIDNNGSVPHLVSVSQMENGRLLRMDANESAVTPSVCNKAARTTYVPHTTAAPIAASVAPAQIHHDCDDRKWTLSDESRHNMRHVDVDMNGTMLEMHCDDLEWVGLRHRLSRCHMTTSKAEV